MCFPKREDSEDANLIVIDDGDEQRCNICGALFKHSKRYMMVEDFNGVREVLFRTAHSGCLKIMKRIKKKTQDITDLEWRIFLKSVDNTNGDNIR
jgi:uncharacterized C2H2 Zn-finger protein